MELKDVKKGDQVILCLFTGVKATRMTVVGVNDKYITVKKVNGDKMRFSVKTGKQLGVEEGKERYASTIIPDIFDWEPPRRHKKGE